MTSSEHEAAKHSWDETWKTAADAPPTGFDEHTLENAIDRGKLEFLQLVLTQSGRAVEIGCGSARLLARVGKATKMDLFGVDTSAEALRVAGQTASLLDRPIRCITGDAGRLPISDGSFDLVLSGGLLEHFPDPTRVMREMVRVLRPGGVFYADVVPRKLSLYRLRESWRILRSTWMLPGVYESRFGPSFYRETLRRLGCDDIRVESCGIYPHVASLRFREATRFLDGTFVAGLLGWYFMIAARKTGVTNIHEYR